jgi:hypothetical protein
MGTKHFAESIDEALTLDTVGETGPLNPASMRIEVAEHNYAKTHVIYDRNGVKVTSFPVVHTTSGAVGNRLDFEGLSFVLKAASTFSYTNVSRRPRRWRQLRVSRSNARIALNAALGSSSLFLLPFQVLHCLLEFL